MPATLHILVGKIASGKSTLAKQLGSESQTVVIAEDDWLSRLFGEEMQNVSYYVWYSARLRTALFPHIVSLLQANVPVVLDFAANTFDMRAWMRDIIDTSGCDHIMHFLDVPDDVCRARMHARNATGTHPFQPNDEQFDWITSHFVPPTESENFNITLYHTE